MHISACTISCTGAMFSRTHLMEWLRHTSISHDRHYGPGTKCTLTFFGLLIPSRQNQSRTRKGWKWLQKDVLILDILRGQVYFSDLGLQPYPDCSTLPEESVLYLEDALYFTVPCTQRAHSVLCMYVSLFLRTRCRSILNFHFLQCLPLELQ